MSKIDWSQYPLGQVSDYKIARCAGTSRTAVFNARRKRGIEGGPTCQELGRVTKGYIWKVVGRHPKTVTEIHRLLLDDYGSIAIRNVHRHLAWFVEHGYLARDRPGGYVRTKKAWTSHP